MILGSGSYTRKLILKEMGIDFQVIKRPIDERSIGDRASGSDPQTLVVTLAKAKMEHLVEQILNGNCDAELPPDIPESGYLLLTGDQVVTHNGCILEKPESIEQAKSFCQRYASSPPSTVGSCIITHIPSKLEVMGVDAATILFRSSIADVDDDGKDVVDRMVAEGAPILDCAGGLMVEHPLVREHVDRINGTEDSVMGLSKPLVLRLLKELKQKLMLEKVLEEARD